jgi:hypothetical protein
VGANAGAARSGGVEVEGSRHAGGADSDAVAEEEFERYTKEIQRQRRAIRAANKPESEMDALFRDEEKRDTTLLNEGRTRARWARSKGRTTRRAATTGRRPTASCSRATTCLCRVCRRAIEQILDLYAR